MTAVPPGVVHDAPLVEVASGGDDKEWNSYSKTKHYTNAFIKQDGKVSQHFVELVRMLILEVVSRFL